MRESECDLNVKVLGTEKTRKCGPEPVAEVTEQVWGTFE